MQTEILNLIQETLEDMGFVVVRILQGTDSKTLQIMAEHADFSAMSIEDCSKIAQTLSTLFNLKAPQLLDYDLEISSPGIDRPLVRAEDYDRFKEREVKLETSELIENRKRFKGILKGLDSSKQNVLILFEDKEIAIPLTIISKAKLLIPSDLLKKK